MEYRSSTSLLGLPLVHVAVGAIRDGKPVRGIARGWIAIGDVAFGVLLSVGGIAFGGFAFGGMAIGVLSLGGLAVGALAVGGGAAGYLAAGGAAFAVKAALGGLAVARDYALGGGAVARHANDAAARGFFEEDLFADVARTVMEHSEWMLLLTAIPVFLALRERKRRGEQGPQA
ncbi:MAG TPA: hypothetical protein VIA64_03070 [Burkholderiales bacterium]